MSCWLCLAHTSFSVNSAVKIYDLIMLMPVSSMFWHYLDARDIGINKIKFPLKRHRLHDFLRLWTDAQIHNMANMESLESQKCQTI